MAVASALGKTDARGGSFCPRTSPTRWLSLIGSAMTRSGSEGEGRRERISLRELLPVFREGTHEEVDWGPPEGEEAW